MNCTKWLLAGVAGVVSAFGAGIPAHAEQPITNLPVNETTSYKGEEYLLIGDAVRGAGEPVIAINPKDPNNIIVGAMASRHYVPGSPFGDTEKPVSPDTILAYRNTPDATVSIYAITNDRGRTWRFIRDPFRNPEGRRLSRA